MSNTAANIKIPVDLNNPGQFFACCGLLELADRLWPGTEGWFEARHFCIASTTASSTESLLEAVTAATVSNTMTIKQRDRLEELSSMTKKQRQQLPGTDEEKSALESLHRELPIILKGPISFRVDWFCDEYAGGSRFKTWAGRQSVLDIADSMKQGIAAAGAISESTLWNSARKIGLPFNFDSDLGSQGSALDIAFSFDALAASDTTRIEGTCRPALEFFAFVGLQRFRPRELPRQNRFIYAAWHVPLTPDVAAPVACESVSINAQTPYEFRLVYRNKYYKSFLPAIPFQGDRNE